MALSLRLPSREPVREYGRGVCVDGARLVDDLKLLVLLGVRPGRAPRVLCDRFLAGVGARLGGLAFAALLWIDSIQACIEGGGMGTGATSDEWPCALPA